jgi:hypothetical protein
MAWLRRYLSIGFLLCYVTRGTYRWAAFLAPPSRQTMHQPIQGNPNTTTETNTTDATADELLTMINSLPAFPENRSVFTKKTKATRKIKDDTPTTKPPTRAIEAHSRWFKPVKKQKRPVQIKVSGTSTKHDLCFDMACFQK